MLREKIDEYREQSKRYQRLKYLLKVSTFNRYEFRINVIFSIGFTTVFFAGHKQIIPLWFVLPILPIIFLFYMYTGSRLYSWAKGYYRSKFELDPKREDRFILAVFIFSFIFIINLLYFATISLVLE